MLYLTIIGGAFIAWLILVFLFTPAINCDFERDLARCDEITLDAWRRRPVLEKLIGTVAWILERQQ